MPATLVSDQYVHSVLPKLLTNGAVSIVEQLQEMYGLSLAEAKAVERRIDCILAEDAMEGLNLAAEVVKAKARYEAILRKQVEGVELTKKKVTKEGDVVEYEETEYDFRGAVATQKQLDKLLGLPKYVAKATTHKEIPAEVVEAYPPEKMKALLDQPEDDNPFTADAFTRGDAGGDEAEVPSPLPDVLPDGGPVAGDREAAPSDRNDLSEGSGQNSAAPF